MITITNLSHTIANNTILNDITINIPHNKLTAIIGPNGAGKSTLLNIMSRLEPMQSGTICYGNIDLRQSNNTELAKVLAVLSQQSYINSRITVTELLMFGRYPHHRGRPQQADYDIIATKIEQFELTHIQHRYIDTLSGGQRQRALIAMTFCQSTPYILLDEPLNNLDLYHTHQLMTRINAVAKEHTLVIVIHDINQAASFADNIIAMQDGKIAYHGSPHEVITSKNIKALFNVDIDIIDYKGAVRIL